MDPMRPSLYTMHEIADAMTRYVDHSFASAGMAADNDMHLEPRYRQELQNLYQITTNWKICAQFLDPINRKIRESTEVLPKTGQ